MDVVPLDNDPQTFNKFISTLGINGGLFFTEVFDRSFVETEIDGCKLEGFVLLKSVNCQLKYEALVNSTKLIHISQQVSNACATIAILHVIMNFKNRFSYLPDSSIAKIFSDVKNMNSVQLSDYLNKNQIVGGVHQGLAGEVSNSITMTTDLHYSVFTLFDGRMYELDGRFSLPIDHGPCENIKKGIFDVIDQITENDNTNLEVSILAFYVK